MFLNGGESGFVRACLLGLALPALMALAACAPRGEASPEGKEKAGSRFGFRLDDGINRQRRALPRRVDGDPCARPSYKELREARAVARAETNIALNGLYPQVLPDGSSSNPDSVRFRSMPGALGLELSSSVNLNRIDGQPHALTLVIYQIADRVALDQLAATREGFAKLLAGERFDDAVKSVRQLSIQPGMSNRLAMERAEDARHVAIVAGYHNPTDPQAYLRVFSYGIGQYSIKGSTPAHRRKLQFRPLPLNLRIELGDEAMTAWETTRIYRNMHDSVKLRSEPLYNEMENQSGDLFAIY